MEFHVFSIIGHKCALISAIREVNVCLFLIREIRQCQAIGDIQRFVNWINKLSNILSFKK